MSQEFLKPTATAAIDTTYGSFVIETFTIGGVEIIVLRSEDIPGKVDDVLCRIQSECVSHAFFDQSCDCSEQIASSLKRIQDAKTGLLIYLRQEGMGLGMAGRVARDQRDWRSYYDAVEILRYYGVRSVQLITLNKRKVEALREGGIEVRSDAWHEGRTIMLGRRIERTVAQVRLGESHCPVEQEPGTPRVLIIGDLNMDDTTVSKGPVVAGSGYNAAIALKEAGKVSPIIFGKVGRDEHGLRIREEIQKNDIYCLLGVHDKKATGFVKIVTVADPAAPFQYEWEKRNNANDYDAKNLRQAIELAGISDKDYVFVSTYLFVQKLFVTEEINEVLRLVSDTNARLILDIVRKSFARDVLQDCGIESFDRVKLQECLRDIRLHTVVGEMGTFNSLGLTQGISRPDQAVCLKLLQFFSANYIVCRYVEGGGRHQITGHLDRDRVIIINDEELPDLRIGLGDEMFAKALNVMRTHEKFNSGGGAPLA